MRVQTAGLAIVVLGAFVVLVVGQRSIGTHRAWSTGRLAALAILLVYVVGVAHYTLLPIRFDYAIVGRVAPWSVLREYINLAPGGYGMPRDQVLANIVLGVPFGFGLPFVWRLPAIGVIALGLLSSLAIETLQLLGDVTGLSAPARSADINDVILNTLGVTLGVLGFVVFRAAYRALFGGYVVKSGLWSHFHETLVGSGPVDATT